MFGRNSFGRTTFCRYKKPDRATFWRLVPPLLYGGDGSKGSDDGPKGRMMALRGVMMATYNQDIEVGH